MNPHALVVGISMGAVLILLGLVPGLFEGLTEGVSHILRSGNPRALRIASVTADRPGPVWLAPAGALLIALSVLAR